MKNYFVRFFLLTVLTGVISFSYSQSKTEIVKQKLEEALKTHLNKVYPPNSCPHNDKAFIYSGDYKITKNQEVGGTLRLWGIASTAYRNARTGGTGNVNFYAEVDNVNGEVTITRLRWQLGICMKFETLYEL